MTTTPAPTETEMATLSFQVPAAQLPRLASMAGAAADRFRFDGRVLGIIMDAANSLPEGTPEIDETPIEAVWSSVDTLARMSALILDLINQIRQDGKALTAAVGITTEDLDRIVEGGELPTFDRTTPEAEVMGQLSTITPAILYLEQAAAQLQSMFQPVPSLDGFVEALEAELARQAEDHES